MQCSLRAKPCEDIPDVRNFRGPHLLRHTTGLPLGKGAGRPRGRPAPFEKDDGTQHEYPLPPCWSSTKRAVVAVGGEGMGELGFHLGDAGRAHHQLGGKVGLFARAVRLGEEAEGGSGFGAYRFAIEDPGEVQPTSGGVNGLVGLGVGDGFVVIEVGIRITVGSVAWVGVERVGVDAVTLLALPAERAAA
jgi:hypothetical protein